MSEQVRRGREGSRWYNERPGAEDFAEWFKTVPLHEGLKHRDFIGGVTLIQQKEKVDEVVGWRDSVPVIMQREHLVYIPHPQVMARVAYFRALRDLHADDWVGLIEPQPAAGDTMGLPPGFFRYTALQSSGTNASFVGCSLRVRILEKGSTAWVTQGTTRVLEGTPVFEGPPGTKVVPVLKNNGWADPNALMRAESGALGRALGMAGMLVIPGAGVATAEDVQEAIALPAELPGVVSVDSALKPPAPEVNPRDRVEQLVAELATADPAVLEQFHGWLTDRSIELETATPAQLKTVIKKLEQTLDRIRSAA